MNEKPTLDKNIPFDIDPTTTTAAANYWERKTGQTGRTISAFCLIANIVIVLAAMVTMAWFDTGNNVDLKPNDPQRVLDFFESCLGLIVGAVVTVFSFLLMLIFSIIGFIFGIDGIISSKTTAETVRAAIYLAVHTAVIATPFVFFYFPR